MYGSVIETLSKKVPLVPEPVVATVATGVSEPILSAVSSRRETLAEAGADSPRPMDIMRALTRDQRPIGCKGDQGGAQQVGVEQARSADASCSEPACFQLSSSHTRTASQDYEMETDEGEV